MSQNIVIGSDHAGFKLKTALVEYLRSKSFDVTDLGCDSESSVNYPDYAHKVAEQVLRNESLSKSKGILVCGSGIGMSIAANRHRGIRAALCVDEEYAKLSREHNDSNVLVLGARFTDFEKAKKILETWLETKFAGDRHEMRVKLIETEV